MCIIIDANVASLFFNSPEHPDAKPIWRWISKNGALVYGGKHAQELARISNATRTLFRLNQAGRAHLAPKSDISEELTALAQDALHKSNDAHILALARATKTRLLFTDDGDLQVDFTNHRIINKPRGKLYSSARNAPILKHTNNCPGGKGRAS